jgi:hypothetical protein
MHNGLFRRVLIGLFVCTVGIPALADTPIGRIRVQATGEDGRPIEARIFIERFDEFNDTTITLELPEGRWSTLANKGQDAWTVLTPEHGVTTQGAAARDVTADKDGKALEPGFYIIRVSTGDPNTSRRIANRIVYIGPGATPIVNFGPSELRPVVGAQLHADVAIAQDALRRGDRALYDEAVASGEARVAEEAEDLRDFDAAIDAWRQANGIPVFRNVRAVRRAIEAGQGTGVPVDQSRIDALEIYEDLLRYRDFMRGVHEEAQKELREIPAWPAEQPAPEGSKTSRLDPAPGSGHLVAGPDPDYATTLPVSIRGGITFGGSNVSAKGDLLSTSGNAAGSNDITDPFIALQATVMMHHLAMQTAAFGSLTPILHFYAAQNLGGFSNVLAARLHQANGNDSFVRFRRGFQAGMALGVAMALSQNGLCGFGSPEGCMDVTLWAGPLLATMATRVISDETGGGGQYNAFTRNDTVLGAMLGMQFSYLVCASCQMPMYLTLGGQLNFTGRPDSAGGMTSPFNFDYDGRVRSYTEAMLWVGVAFQLDQLFRTLARPAD